MLIFCDNFSEKWGDCTTEKIKHLELEESFEAKFYTLLELVEQEETVKRQSKLDKPNTWEFHWECSAPSHSHFILVLKKCFESGKKTLEV